MKIALTLLTLACTLASTFATVTLQFSTASSKLTNIQNSTGTASGGLKYGIVIDTTGNGFSSSGTNYDGFALPTANTGLYLAKGSDGSITDDFFYWTGVTTVASVGGTDGGVNAVTGNFFVDLDLALSPNNVTTGDAFALMWFDANATDGEKYGFLTISGGANPFTIPANGATVSYSPNFTGVDSARLANNTLGAAPEPSRLFLAGLGMLGLLARRRRSR